MATYQISAGAWSQKSEAQRKELLNKYDVKVLTASGFKPVKSPQAISKPAGQELTYKISQGGVLKRVKERPEGYTRQVMIGGELVYVTEEQYQARRRFEENKLTRQISEAGGEEVVKERLSEAGYEGSLEEAKKEIVKARTGEPEVQTMRQDIRVNYGVLSPVTPKPLPVKELDYHPSREDILKAVQGFNVDESREPKDYQGTKTSRDLSNVEQEALKASKTFIRDQPVIERVNYQGATLERGRDSRFETQGEFLTRAITYAEVTDVLTEVKGAPKSAVFKDEAGQVFERSEVVGELVKAQASLSEPPTRLVLSVPTGEFSYSTATYYAIRDAGLSAEASSFGAGFVNVFESVGKVVLTPFSYEFVKPKIPEWGQGLERGALEGTPKSQPSESFIKWRPELVREGVEGQGLYFELGVLTAQALATELVFKGIGKTYNYLKAKELAETPIKVETASLLTGRDSYVSFAVAQVDDYTVYGSQSGLFYSKPAELAYDYGDEVIRAVIPTKQPAGLTGLRSGGAINVGVFKGGKAEANLLYEFKYLGSQQAVLTKVDDVTYFAGQAETLELSRRASGGEWIVNKDLSAVEKFDFIGAGFKVDGGTRYLEPYLPDVKFKDLFINVGGESQAYSFSSSGRLIKVSGVSGDLAGTDLFLSFTESMTPQEASKLLKSLRLNDKALSVDVAQTVGGVAGGLAEARLVEQSARTLDISKALAGGAIIIEAEDVLKDVFESPALKTFEPTKRAESPALSQTPQPLDSINRGRDRDNLRVSEVILSAEDNAFDLDLSQRQASKARKRVKPETGLVPDVDVSVSDDVITEPVVKPVPSVRREPRINQGRRYRSGFEQLRKTVSDVFEDFGEFPFNDFPSPKPPTGKPALGLPSLALSNGKRGGLAGFKELVGEYLPSLTARVKGKRGVKPETVLGRFTGLEERPLIEPEPKPVKKKGSKKDFWGQVNDLL